MEQKPRKSTSNNHSVKHDGRTNPVWPSQIRPRTSSDDPRDHVSASLHLRAVAVPSPAERC